MSDIAVHGYSDIGSILLRAQKAILFFIIVCYIRIRVTRLACCFRADKADEAACERAINYVNGNGMLFRYY